MKTDTLVDILLPTYNTNEQYLREQINSLLNQTHKNIKIYISDDASTNRCVLDVLNEYKNKDSRITVFVQEQNIGYNKNFEFLLKQSTADYIMFADHDDIWYKDKVKKSLERIIEDKVDLVYVNAEQIDERGTVIQKNYFKYKNVPVIKGKSKLAISRCAGIGCSQIFTKNIKEKMLPFKDSVIAHDWLVAFLANENRGMSYIEEPLFGYRLHDSNVFGGRNLAQNLKRWKDENGTTYTSYLKYRQKKVIEQAYLNGALMCMDYAQNDEDKIFLKNIIKYYENLKKTKYVNIHLIKYFRFLSGKNLFKKMIKELIIFHFPICGYLKFRF